MVLFLREMKRNRKAFIIWTTLMVVYNVLVFTIYPSFKDQGDSYMKMLDSMPVLKSMFGMDQLDFKNILSYYGTYSSLYYLLFGSIYAMILGAGILSKEENDKTIEFLLSKPVTRTSIVTSKVLCTFLYLFLFNFVYSISSFVLVNIYSDNPYNSTALILFLVSPLIVFFIFAAIGIALSVFIVKTKSILPLAIGTALGSFLLGAVSAITKQADWLKYLSPFKYIDSANILKNQQIDLIYIIIFVSVTVLSVASTYVFYTRKDITT